MRCACSTTIRAARRAGCARSKATSSSSPATSAMPPPSMPPCAASRRSTTSPSSTAREFFYSAPELVLDVGVKGMVNVIDACRAAGVGRLVLASSSEVYQTPPQVPTDESAPLIVPDPTQPALFLRRRQDHQRADGDQLRPQISSSAC